MTLKGNHAFISPKPQGGDATRIYGPQWNADISITGTADASQLNANVVQSVANDTNIQGAIAAQTLTFSWGGTLAAARGGFGADVSASSGVPLFATGVATFTGTTGTGNFARATSPTFVTPTLGAASATTLNGNTFTTGTYTLAGAAGKTLTFNNSLTLGGTDGTTMTFPSTSATIARTDAANTFTGTQTIGALVATTFNGNTITAGSSTLTLSANLTINTATAISAGVAGQVGIWNAGNLSGSATPTLGASGTLGSVTFGNATSGLVTLQPVTGALGTVTLSLPAATDTLVGKATTDTFTNKTFNTAAAGNVFAINGNTISTNTGTGSVNVLSASPTFTGSPVLAAPSATTLIVGASTTLPSPSSAVITQNSTTLPNGPAGTVLHVAGANSSTSGILLDTFNASSVFTFRTAMTSAASPSAMTAGSVMLSFGGIGYGATAYSTSARMQIVGKATEAWSDTAQGTSLQFNTTPNGSVTPALALLMQNSGGCSIGTSTDGGIGSLLANTSIKSQSATAGIGYATGAGGTVTQITSKATAVTLNTVTGAITLNNAALAATTIVSFVWNNSAIAATDYIGTAHESGGTTGAYTINARATGAGTAAIDVRNNTAGSLSEAIVIRFFVHKSVNA